MLTIVCHVAAVFHDRSGRTVLAVSPSDTDRIIQAPEEIQEDPLFGMLTADGTLQAVASLEDKRRLENNPLTGIDAEGKRMTRRAEDASAVASEHQNDSGDDAAGAAEANAGADAPTASAAAAPARGRKASAK